MQHTLAEALEHEIERIKGSRFIAHGAPATTREEADAVLAAVRAARPSAGHHAFAYRLGAGGEDHRSSDDGEPAGSSGRPILAQLEGHAVTDTIVVVSRWFGGVKLGVGGLMRAYGGAAGKLLDQAERQGLYREVIAKSLWRVEHAYADSAAVQAWLAARGQEPRDALYDERVRFSVELEDAEAEDASRALRDATGGRAEIRPSPG